MYDNECLFCCRIMKTISVLDVFVPTMASSARGGAGFGIGANLVGFPGGL